MDQDPSKPFFEASHRQRGWILLLFALGLSGGCGGEIDTEDESSSFDVKTEEYELILVDADHESKIEAEKNQIVEEETKGIAPVDSSSANPRTLPIDTDVPKVVRYNPEGEFTVQIGGYSNAKVAGEKVQQLSQDGFPAYAIKNPQKKGFRVRIGYFSTQSDAKRFGELMKKDRGWDFWVDRRANEIF